MHACSFLISDTAPSSALGPSKLSRKQMMLWSRLRPCRRVFSPLIFRSSALPSPPFRAACGKSLLIAQRPCNLRARSFRCVCDASFRPAKGPSAPAIDRSVRPFCASFLSDNVSENQAEIAACEAVDQGVLPAPAPAGDASGVLYPTLIHSSTFLQIFSQEEKRQDAKDTFALVILNYELPLLTLFLWSEACCHICADGGANQLYDIIPSLFPHKDPMRLRKHYKPDIIKGDLDSIRPEVKEFYSRLGTQILDNSEDQETTDLWKCAAHAVDNLPDIKRGQMKLLVLGALGGRLDHTFANLNTLHLFKEARLVLLNDENMTFLLPKGYRHEIWIDSSIEGPHCGLLPLGGPSLCTTTEGLKWDLNKTSLHFGGLISTSNMPVGNRVKVTSDADLVWTISLQMLRSHLKKQVGSANLLPF